MSYRPRVTVVLQILVACTFLICHSLATAQTSGLVAAYGFNEGSGTTVTDASGNNNNGTLGSGVTRSTQGKFGSALVFNSSSFVTIPATASLNLTIGMTLEAWVYPTATPTNWSTILMKEQPGEFVYVLYAGSPTNRSNVYFNTSSSSSGEHGIAGPSALPLNTWTHLAATYDGATLCLYVNGALVASQAFTGAIVTSTGALRIGGNSVWGEYFRGRIDEVRIYNRALSRSEIQTDMNTAVGSTPAPNTLPTISPIAAQVTDEDTSTGAIPFTVGDVETAAGSLTVSGNSSNPTLVPNGNIVFGGSGANRTVAITPAANQNGTATITVAVSDGQASTPTSFLLTVNAVNDAPMITPLANQTTTVGTAVGPLNFTVGDVDTAVVSLTVSGSSSNPTLVPNGNIVFGGSGANRTVTITPAANQTGVATITVAVSDGLLSTPTSFQCTVNPPNTSPTISPIAAQVTDEDTSTGAIPFTVGDVETAAGSLTVSGSSSNPTLVPNGNIVFGGSGANRTVAITPAANQNGTATITVAVSDGQASTPTSFLLTVNAVNDAPMITPLANQTTTVGTAVGPLNFTVGDVDTAVVSLTVSGSSSNPTLVPNGNIVFGGSGANRTVTITPAANQTGVATITVAVSDGLLSTPTSFQCTVNATPTGLIAAYGFNETSGTIVTDASGHNNSGTISGATWTTAGKFGSALVFNGTNARVTINDSSSLRLTTGMTLEAWVNPSTVTNVWRDVIYKGNDNYYLEATSDPNRVPGGGGTFGGADVLTYGTAALPVNTWTHLALTYDGATLRLYVNGVQVATLARTGNLAASTNPLQIGGDSIYGQYFQGTIDEVRVYNRALSQAELQIDMNTPVNGTPPPPDTIPPTVALASPPVGSTVFSLVSVSANVSDNVGVAGVQFLLDSAPLGAEATVAPYAVVWDTTSVPLGSHSLAAVARDFAGNTATSAPVSVTVTATNTSLVGQWSAPVTWPIVAVNAALLPTGQILAWDGQTAGHDARLWNPTTGVFTAVPNNQTNMFCTGQCALADGRTLVAGGHAGGHIGVPDTNLFDPVARTWTKVTSMAYPRWYPTTTTLPDGRVLVTAGEINCDRCDAPIPEVYNAQTNVWTQLAGASLVLPYYPHMFVLPDLVGDGHIRVLAAATAEDLITTYVLDVNTQTWSTVDPDPVDGGSSAMYLSGKVLKSGTSTDPDMPVFPSEATTYVLDMTEPSPAWRETAPMVFQRTYHTLTLLPDGTVLATGGGVTTDAVGVNGAVSRAELWSPVTETWTTMASMQKPRLYHSTALLLPDGRVVAMGGGRFNGVNEPTDQLSSETYSPPYLFKGTRPTISAAPATATYGGTIAVQTPDAARIAAVSLLRLGAVTHAFDQDQRFVPLPFTTISGALTVQAPANANLAPPGYYMLFILDMNGIPSVAAILKLQ